MTAASTSSRTVIVSFYNANLVIGMFFLRLPEKLTSEKSYNKVISVKSSIVNRSAIKSRY